MTVQGSEVPRRTLRKQREKEQRMSAILSAAEQLFATKGYQQTSIEEIADFAEVSTGTIYFYFKNKEDLLIQVMDDCALLLRKTLGEGLAGSDLSIEGFCKVGGVFLKDICLRYPEKITILFRESVAQTTKVEERRKEQFEKLTGDLKRALEEVGRREGRVITPPLAELMAVLTVGVYAQTAYHYLIWRNEPGKIDDINKGIISFLLAGINTLSE